MAAQEGRPDTLWWCSAATRRKACHPLPLLVSHVLGAVQCALEAPFGRTNTKTTLPR